MALAFPITGLSSQGVSARDGGGFFPAMGLRRASHPSPVLPASGDPRGEVGAQVEFRSAALAGASRIKGVGSSDILRARVQRVFVIEKVERVLGHSGLFALASHEQDHGTGAVRDVRKVVGEFRRV